MSNSDINVLLEQFSEAVRQNEWDLALSYAKQLTEMAQINSEDLSTFSIHIEGLEEPFAQKVQQQPHNVLLRMGYADYLLSLKEDTQQASMLLYPFTSEDYTTQRTLSFIDQWRVGLLGVIEAIKGKQSECLKILNEAYSDKYQQALSSPNLLPLYLLMSKKIRFRASDGAPIRCALLQYSGVDAKTVEYLCNELFIE